MQLDTYNTQPSASIRITRQDFDRLQELVNGFKQIDEIECTQEQNSVRFKFFLDGYEISFKRTHNE